MPRGRPKGQVSTGPLELVGLLRHCEWIAREKLKLPAGISEREEGRKLAFYFLTNGRPWKGFKIRQRDSDCEAAPNGDTLRKQLRIARQIRDATPKAWACFAEVLAKKRAPSLTEPERLDAVDMVLYVAHGIVEEREVDTLFANLSALYHNPDYYMGTWIDVVRRIKEGSGVKDLRDLPRLLRQSA